MDENAYTVENAAENRSIAEAADAMDAPSAVEDTDNLKGQSAVGDTDTAEDLSDAEDTDNLENPSDTGDADTLEDAEITEIMEAMNAAEDVDARIAADLAAAEGAESAEDVGTDAPDGANIGTSVSENTPDGAALLPDASAELPDGASPDGSEAGRGAADSPLTPPDRQDALLGSLHRLRSLFPDMQKIPEEVTRAIHEGQDAVAAYASYRIRQDAETMRSLREKVSALEQNAVNRDRAVVRGVAGETGQRAKDPWLEGFDSYQW